MQKPINSEARKKDYSHSCLKPVDAYIRGQLDELIQKNENKPVKAHVLANLEIYSIQRRAMALLENKVIAPNHRCKECNGKGYQLERGDKTGKILTNGKPEYRWFTKACICITKSVKPTDHLDARNIPLPEPEINETGNDQGNPVKAGAKAKRAPRKTKAEQSPDGTGTPSPKKRTKKV